MIEAIFAIVVAIIEAAVGLLTALLEVISGFFAAGGALSFFDAILVFFLFVIELLVWAVLWLAHALVALITWKKMKKMGRPIIWRPKMKIAGSEENPDSKKA